MFERLPNLLTLSRIVAVPLVAGCALGGSGAADIAATALFTAAALTDWLDGKLARSWQVQSEFGRMLDPIADKLLVGASLLVLAWSRRLPGGSFYPALVILCREILVSGLREYLATLSVGLPVARLAKWKTGAQMAALGCLLCGARGAAWAGAGAVPVAGAGAALLWLAAGLTLVTGWDYLLAGLDHSGGRDVARLSQRAANAAPLTPQP